MECYCLPAATINAISHVTFLVFDFSIVVYVRLLFQLQGQNCFCKLTTFIHTHTHMVIPLGEIWGSASCPQTLGHAVVRDGYGDC